MTKRLHHLLISLTLLMLGLGLRVADPAFVRDIRHSVFDEFQRLAPRTYKDAPVLVIDLDDETLEKLGQWPWPRSLVARLIDRLTELGVAAIALDMVFSEPDRTSPSSILPMWFPDSSMQSLGRQITDLSDHDRLLADAISRSNVATGFVLNQGKLHKWPTTKKGFSFAGDNPIGYLPQYTGAVVNLPEIEAASAGNGSLNTTTERDGMNRRLPLLLALEDRIYPSLTLEALRLAQGGEFSFVVKSSGASGETSYGAQIAVNHIGVGGFIIPTDAEGHMWLHYTLPTKRRSVSAWRVLEPDYSGDDLEGFFAVVGTSAAGLKDQRTTPLASDIPGVEIHAQALEQIILGEYLVRPDWASGAELAYLAALGLLLIMLLTRVGALPCAAIGLIATAGAFGFSWHAYIRLQWLLDPVYPALVTFLIYSTVSLLNYLRTEEEKRFVRDAFGRYMSPALVERLSDHPEELALGGETRNVTMLFCDIRGFTAISEQLDAAGLTRFINSFLTPMTTVVLDLGGTVDKYMGDCIMAFWNAPLDDPEHARHACEAALAMQYVLTELNDRWDTDGVLPGPAPKSVAIGVGINSGDCSVGNMGSDQRFDYSVLGDDVNLASRLEGQSKVYGVPVVVGENTITAISDFAVLELDTVRVRGKTRPVRIFALLGDAVAKDTRFKNLSDHHNELLAAYRSQDWGRAEALVTVCRAVGDERLTVLYNLYAERITQYKSFPPDSDWDGVFTAPDRSVGGRYFQVGDGASVWTIKQLLFSKTDSIHHAVMEKSDTSGETEVIPLYVLENPSNYRPDRREADRSNPAGLRRRSTDTIH